MNEYNNNFFVKFNNMVKDKSIAIHPKAKELVAAEVKRMRSNGLCASEKMVVTNCIYQVLGKQVETK